MTRGDLVLTADGRQLHLGRYPAQVVAAVRALRVAHATECDALVDAIATNDPATLAAWHYVLGRMHETITAEYRVPEALDVGRVVPYSVHWRAPSVPLAGDAIVSLSRFAMLHVDDGQFVVESPLAYAALELQPASLGALALLAEPVAAQTLCDPQRDDHAGALVHMLHVAGLLATHDRDGRSSDDALTAEGWTLPDAMLHARSRLGRHRGPVGARAETRVIANPPSVPVVRRVALPAAPPAGVASAAREFDDVLASRRSRRAYDARPMDVGQLAELLMRACREDIQQSSDGMSRTARLSPSGGGCNPLDVYVAVSECEGLEPGLYRYDRGSHALDAVASSEDGARTLVQSGRAVAGRHDAGQALVILAANFARTAARYDAIAYALVLKDAGAELQTLQLVATAMGLAACPIGCGDSELFSRLIGQDYFACTSVGEMLVGRAAADTAT